MLDFDILSIRIGDMQNRNKQEDLLKLADAFYENLEREKYCEYGGWGLDDKRPFGNSSVEEDIAEIIELELPDEENMVRRTITSYCNELYDELGEFLRSQWKEFRKL